MGAPRPFLRAPENAMKSKIRGEFSAFRLLLKSVPPLMLTMFVMAVFSMNLLANKSITLPYSWLALDCGITVSWFAFLAMDVITKHFGAKAATELSVLALLINLAFCLLFALAARIPGMWGEAYVDGSEALINSALNSTFGGTWYVLAGSSLAFLVSSAVNNSVNAAIGRALRRKDGSFAEFAARSYISTAVGQFADNLVFALTVSHVFFGWSLAQCFSCAAAGMLAELLCEVAFSGLGFRICARWRRDKVGAEYFEFIDEGRGNA